MRKDNIMFVVLGLVVGLTVGFMVANSINRSSFEKQPASTASSGDSNNNPALPPNHPPLGTTNGEQTLSEPNAPLPQVMEAIDKAKSQPQNYEAQMTAADLYYQIQRYDDAAEFYEIANKLRPAVLEPMIKAGNVYFDSEKYEQAEKWYLLALQKEPKNINVRTDLGLTFFLRSPRDIDRAIKEYKTSLSVDPNHEITLQNLVLAYRDSGDKNNLETTIERLRKINPNNPAIANSSDAITNSGDNEKKDLLLVSSKWSKGGFGAVGLWTVTIKNTSNKPLGDIKFSTEYFSETKNVVSRGGIKGVLGKDTIEKIVPPKSTRTFEVNDGFIGDEAVSATFQIESWRVIN